MTHTTRRSAAGALALGVACLIAGAPALAHGPTRQRVSQTVDIAKPPEAVWAIIKDFDGFSRWHPLVASSTADRGSEVGSKRTVVLKAPGDPSFVEELVKYNDAERSLSYKIEAVDPKVLPVNTYTAWLEVRPNPAGGSTVEWRAAFYRGYMLNDPPPDLNDAAAVKAVTGVVRAGLDNLKRIAEAGS